jgi:hypothetical protein
MKLKWNNKCIAFDIVHYALWAFSVILYNRNYHNKINDKLLNNDEYLEKNVFILLLGTTVGQDKLHESLDMTYLPPLG